MNKRNWTKKACALFVMCAAAAITLPAQTLTTLVSFDGTNGSNLYFAPIQGGDGNLYGITNNGANGWGTVFKVTPTGTLTTLYSFCAQTNCPDGGYPNGLVLATDGNFYGTTTDGGTSTACGTYGCGTVFKITPAGTLTTLYSFCSLTNCADGDGLNAGLVQAVDGNLYGVTEGGGTGGYGTVFKITRGGKFTTLYSFCSLTNCVDGAYPYGALVQAKDGNFYGTTTDGGTSTACGRYGCGTVFKITPQGTLTTIHGFCPQGYCADGRYPYAGLIQATDGNLYGTTDEGGAYDYGTVFKITPQGSLTRLYSFCSQNGCTDGELPVGGLVEATDGNLYGTTPYGGATACGTFGCGTAFKITLDGTLTTLYNFCSQSNCPDGYYPYDDAGLFQGTDGNLYGTTATGGAYQYGTVFSLSVGLGPFVETLPTLGPVGAPVKILGTNLTGTTSVTFNGTAATFTVNSTGTAIRTTVPSGATSGTVQVVTPGGTLSSNVPFRVRQ